MKFALEAKTVSIVGITAFAALVVAAAPAAADPAPPPPPLPVPAPLPAPEPLPAAEPLAAELPPPLPAPTPAEAPALPPAADVPAQALATSSTDPAGEGVPHLLSPENLPPGTSDAPVAPSQPRLTYLQDLWHAMQTQEISGSDALLLLTQRPMVANATPPQGIPAGPQAPLPPDALPPADAPPPADALPLAEAPPIAP